MDKDILIASLCTYMRILSIRVQMTSRSRASIVEMFDGHAVWVTGVQGNEGGKRSVIEMFPLLKREVVQHPSLKDF